MKKAVRKYADYIGISGSTVCLIHCLSSFLLPFIGAEFLHANDGLGKYHDIVLSGLSIIAVYYAMQTTEILRIKQLLVFFVTLLIITVFLHSFSPQFEWAIYVSYFASLGLISTHLYNIYHHRIYKKSCSV